MRSVLSACAAAAGALLLIACGSSSGGESLASDSPPPASGDQDAGPAGDDGGSPTTMTDAGDSGDSGDATAPPAPRPLPHLLSSTELCHLINATSDTDPTPNQTQTLANVLGTDLGIPVDHQGTLYFFFGDTIGYKGIWPSGQSHPDAVGFSTVPSSTVATAPDSLCQDLRFVTLPPSQSIGPTVDPSIQADFAGAAMAPPSGHALSEFIHDPAGNFGANQFPNLPGDFEVPSGAFSYGGSIYVFYTTVDSSSDVVMKASYLARWAAPSTTSPPDYDVLYGVDEQFDTSSPLYGDFVNVAAATSGSYVYLFGTGDYRKSAIHLARKPLAQLDTPGGFELFDATSGTWGTTEGAPVVDIAGFGEVSVRYFAAIDRWMLLAEEQAGGNNRIVARFADAPEGPWSEDIVVYDMADPAFRSLYCCDANACNGQQLFHCNDAGFYATYLLPDVQLNADGTFTVTHTMSTWDPYDVALMQATFATGP